MEWGNLILSILSALIVVIPLVNKLVETVQKYVKEKNWSVLMELLLDYMAEAESLYNSGAERKEYVLAMVEASAVFANCEVDIEVISKMIDTICAASKKINVGKTTEPAAETVSDEGQVERDA